jgi:hypothetical protein
MKPRLTFEQHVVVGASLAAIRDELLTVGVTVANAYPKASRSSRSLLRALSLIDEARWGLDSDVHREHPAVASPENYYPDRRATRRTT